MKRLISLSLIVFLVSLMAAAQPNPIYPVGTIHTLTPLFQWSLVGSATNYRLQVNSGPNIIIDQIVALNQYQTPSGVLTANSIYYWRIASISTSSTTWSGYSNFNITLNPDPPVLLLPADSALLCSGYVMFDWTDVTGALSYRIQASQDSNFTNIVLDVSGLTNSGYTLTASILNYYTLYYWRVMAYFSGSYTNWSAKRKFIVGGVPAPPTFITCPVGTIHTLTPAFVWAPAAGVIGYRLMLSINPLFTTPIYDTTVYASAMTLRPGVLVYNSLVYYRSCALSSCGQGPWSTTMSFTVTPMGIKKLSEEIPTEYSLSQNYPNPFNPVTRFTIDIAKTSDTKIKVFDIAGREVRTLVSESLTPGTYEVRFDGSGLNSGVYFVRMTAGEYFKVIKITLVK